MYSNIVVYRNAPKNAPKTRVNTYTRIYRDFSLQVYKAYNDMKKKDFIKAIQEVSDEAEIRVHIFTKHRTLTRPITKVWVSDVLRDYEDTIIIEVEK